MNNRCIAVLLLGAMLAALVGCSGYRDVPNDVGKNAYPVEAYRTTMQYYDDFKILQITDLHLGIETDVAHQQELVKKAIATEQPDLIVLTGDNFMYATKGIVNSLMATLNEACAEQSVARGGRLCKFTVTFGNHDNQGDYSRYYINRVISSYATEDGREMTDRKFAAFVDYEDDNIFGLTNFYIDLVDDVTKDKDGADVKYRIHIIDSNTYHFMGPNYDYDVMHDDQLAHAANVYASATADKDYIGLAFFHIPLCEYQDAYDQFVASDKGAPTGQGECRENALYGYENNGAYQKLREAGIVAFFCGHDHINHGDFIYNADSPELADRAVMCYGVKSTNQLYHDTDMIGYKTVTLRDVSASEFISMDYISANFKNFTGGYGHYEDGR